MSAFCLQLVEKHFPALRSPFSEHHAQYVLLELSDAESESHANTMLEALATDAIDRGLIQDAVVASSLSPSPAMWQFPETISMDQGG